MKQSTLIRIFICVLFSVILIALSLNLLCDARKDLPLNNIEHIVLITACCLSGTGFGIKLCKEFQISNK